MRFVVDRHMGNWYGYKFEPGKEVDVKEKNLIKKLRNLPYAKEVRRKTNDND